jgi:HK97 family phage portal protein
MRKPNTYQSGSDFMLNLTRWLYCNGNAYALALRNDRNEISELHLMASTQCRASVADGGEVFYQLGGNEIIDRRLGSLPYVPARDVLHVRLHTPRHVLHGETPLMAAALDVAAGNVMLQRQIDFFTNRAQPSFILGTDEKMTGEQMKELRDAWDNQTRGANAGGTPILSWGIKPHQVGSTAQDSQLAETMKMSEQNVALAFRVPMQVLGIGNNTYSSTESLMQSWIASGLGFCLNHIEEAYGLLFGLRGMPDEYLELDTRALLRSSFKERMEGLAKGVLGGVYSPDEARALEELPLVPGGYGKEPRLQEQVVPLSWHAEQAKLLAEQAAQPQPAAPSEPDEANDEEARQFMQKVMVYARHVQ